MDQISNGKDTLGTATIIHKNEEMPYAGKSIGGGSPKDSSGLMTIEGDSGVMGSGPNRGNVSNVLPVSKQ